MKACIFKIQALCWRSLKGSAALKYTCKRKISSDYNPDNKLKGKSNMTTNFHEKTTFHNNLKLNSDKKILQQLNGSQSDKHNQNQKFFLFLHLFCNNAISKQWNMDISFFCVDKTSISVVHYKKYMLFKHNYKPYLISYPSNWGDHHYC